MKKGFQILKQTHIELFLQKELFLEITYVKRR